MKKELNTIEELNKEKEVLLVRRKNIELTLALQVQSKLIELLGEVVNLRVSCNISKWYGENRCSFEIEFISENGKADFGSDFHLYYEDKEVKINTGTIGTYSKHNKFQVLRIKLLNALWEKVEEMEQVFKDFEKGFKEYNECVSLYYEYDDKIDSLKREERENAYKKIEEDLKVDDSYQVVNKYGDKGNIYKIIKITDKLIYVEYKDNWQSTWTKQFKKREFVIEVYNNGMTKVEN